MLKALSIQASTGMRRHPDRLDIHSTDGSAELLDDNLDLTQEGVKLGWQVEDIANAYNFVVTLPTPSSSGPAPVAPVPCPRTPRLHRN